MKKRYIIRLIQFENAVQSLCVFKHTNTVRIALKIKLFFQNFPHISIYNDLPATNHNSLVKKRDMESLTLKFKNWNRNIRNVNYSITTFE